ncbi:MAG: GNAT family N-acetyltransferase [Actinomycetota bacterium]
MTPRDRFRRALAHELAVAPEAIDRPATVVVPEDDRAGSGLAVAYAIGQLTAIRCDPALAPALAPLSAPDRALSFEELEAWTGDRDWSVVDGNDNHVLPAGWAAPTLTVPQDGTLVDLDTSDATTQQLIADLVEATGDDDAEEAEVDLEDLDALAVALLDGDGAIAAFASARPWDVDETFDDIGVLVHPDRRRGGWGTAAVLALVARSLELDRHPLYRCNWTVTGSKRLAVGLGFEVACRLLAVAADG